MGTRSMGSDEAKLSVDSVENRQDLLKREVMLAFFRVRTLLRNCAESSERSFNTLKVCLQFGLIE